MTKVQVLNNGVVREIEEHALPLISVSPMSNVHDKDVNDYDNSTSFDAVTPLCHIEDIFEFFGVRIHDWDVGSIANNCSVNNHWARLLDVPHVGCISHKLHLHVTKMFDGILFIKNMVDSNDETMLLCKLKILRSCHSDRCS